MCDLRQFRCVAMDAGPVVEAGQDALTDVPATVDSRADAATDQVADRTADARPDLLPDRAPDAAGSCGTNVECPTTAKQCVANRCVECAADEHCARPRPACNANACVECTRNDHCTDPGKPICANRVCRPCGSDAECAARPAPNPGICLAGRCAEETETIYVQNRSGCALRGAAGGSPAAPYCEPQAGLDVVTAIRRVLLLRGPNSMPPFAYNLGGPPVVVVGQANARINPGALVGIRVSAGELIIRSVTVSAGDSAGVIAENGAVLRMNRCVVENNRGGGVYVNGAGFDITSTVLAGNQGEGFDFGGASLLAPGGAPQRFMNNTVVDNKKFGLLCGQAYAVKGLLLNGNGVDIFTCVATSSKVGVGPMFDPARPYHLLKDSPCHDQGDATDFPSDDIDGEPRPRGMRSDCGADEFQE